MKYAIIKVINGNYFIHAEGITDLSAAKVVYHGLCQTLWNAPDALSAYVMIADEQLDVVEGYKEYIHHTATAPQPASSFESDSESEVEFETEPESNEEEQPT